MWPRQLTRTADETDKEESGSNDDVESMETRSDKEC